MKRFTIAFVVVLFGYVGMVAQEDYKYNPLVREGVEWGYYNYIYIPNSQYNSYRIQFKGNTVIEGKTYKNAYAYISCTLDDDAYLAGWIREENQKVFFIINPDYEVNTHTRFHKPNVQLGVEYVIYDFTPVKVGDKVTLWGEEFAVEDLQYVDVNGSLHKQLKYSAASWLFPVIDGQGYINQGGGNVILPGSDVPTNGSQFSTLNYIKQTGGYFEYQSPDFNINFNDPCLASVDGVIKDRLNIYQDINTIAVEIPANDKMSSIELVDVAGRVVRSEAGVGNDVFTIATAELPKGAYIVIVSTSTNRYTEKVVIK